MLRVQCSFEIEFHAYFIKADLLNRHIPPKTNLDIKRQKISQLQNFIRYCQSRFKIAAANVTK